MKQILFLIGIVAAFCSAGCSKDETQVFTTIPLASVSLTNANASGKSLDFFIDGVKKNQVATVGANGTIIGTYVGLNDSSAHTLVVNDAATGNAELYRSSLNIQKGKAYSFIVYDTLKSGKLNGILLTSDRTIAINNTSTSNVRFLNLSPKSPDLDLWLVRRVGGILKDSVVLGPQPYLGSISSPNVATLSAFKSVISSEVAGSLGVGIASTDYLFKLKLAGTNTLVSTSAATLLIPARNYTLFARGIYPAAVITVLLNN